MLGLPTPELGIPKLGWLNALHICTANCSRSFSVKLNHFPNVRSSSTYPGARRFEKYRGALPKVKSAGAEKAAGLKKQYFVPTGMTGTPLAPPQWPVLNG